MTATRTTGAALADAALSPARSRALAAAVQAIIWTSDAEGCFVEEQPAWQAYTGQTWEECRGWGRLRVVHPDDRAALEAAWHAAKSSRRLYVASYRIWHVGSGGYRQVSNQASPVFAADGRIIEWVGTISDIHEIALRVSELNRVNARLSEQLQAHEVEMRRLFELSLDVMLSIGADGRVLAASPSFTDITGLPHAQAVGRDCTDLIVPEQAQQVRDELASALAGRNIIDFETRLLHRDGGTRVVSWRAVGVPQEGRVYAIGRDVTTRKLAQERTIRAERLQAVGQFTGGVAHDFNNVLAAIMGYLEIASRLARDEKMSRTITRAMDASRRGAKLVGQLLSFARKQELSLEAVDLNQLVRELQPLIEQATRSTVALHLDLDEHLPEATADPTQIEMVLVNLSINARDAMPQGGVITLRTWQHTITDQPATRIDGLPDGRYACISVVDSGVGMDEATLARCQEPFFTTKAQGRGTGLGLAQVLGAVQHCGGALRIQSQLGVGTQADVVLPLAGEPASTASAQATTAAARVVMVVEDDPDVLNATASLLETLGFGALRYLDPGAAISALALDQRIDVVLVDYNMPALNGVEVLRQALRLRPEVLGIVMTAQMDVQRIRAALPEARVVQKPLQVDQLAALVSGARERSSGEGRSG